MIEAADFLDHLVRRGLTFFSGVPDSLLGRLCADMDSRLPAGSHVVAPNEGIALALAAGHYLATGAPPVVYLQNSGLGNVVNPLVSLAAKAIYGIPVLLIVGWRGEMQGVGGTERQLADEPQHQVQGRITLKQLDVLEVPCEVLHAERNDWRQAIDATIDRLRAGDAPAALVIRKDTFGKGAGSGAASANAKDGPPRLTREQAIACCLRTLPQTVPVVATTGMAGREVFELRRQWGQSHDGDFLCVGGMGYASQIAAGIAMARPQGRVACIDGDGALVMHMGGMALAARRPNLVHVVMNNEAHESVGGHPSAAAGLDLAAVARAVGYAHVHRAATAAGIERAVSAALAADGSTFIEVPCSVGHRADLGRPTITPAKSKEALMRFLAAGGERVK